MSVSDLFGKLDDTIYESIKMVTDWAREPLEGREHSRQMERDRAHLNARMEEASHAANIRMQEAEHAAALNMEQKNLDTKLKIRIETEIHRIMLEIEELRKDAEFQRMKSISDAIMQYQEYLTRLNVNAINAIGCMQLELREKAQKLVYEKTCDYENLQRAAHTQAFEEIKQIEAEFSGNEFAKNILYKSVEFRLTNMITTAQNFLLELNKDISVLNGSINLLTESGQAFIQEHLGQFHLVTNSGLLANNALLPNEALLKNKSE